MSSGDPHLDLNVRIARTETVAEDIHTFEFRNADGGELPPFTAGAHIAVRVPNGMVRKFSLCNDPAERDRYLIAVKREPESRGGTASMIDEGKVGGELRISVPHNNFALVRSTGGYIFIAGGIGITPIMSMIRHLRSAGDGKFKLYYCARSPAATAFRDELSDPDLQGKVVIHHDAGDPARQFDFWPVLERPTTQHIYCCGPRSMMQAVRDMSGHWFRSNLHFEAFTEPPRNKAEDRPFTVRLARSGGRVEVPVGTTILEALRAHGLDVPSSCESGTCGTCRTRLIEGEADHRDLVLSEDEHADNIMICVSRARTRELVIDR